MTKLSGNQYNYIKKLLLTLSVVLISSFSYGSHNAGGEISWTCSGNGQYKFRLVLYRDCSGITMLNSVTMNSSVGNIVMTLVSQEQIVPTGYLANGVNPCSICDTIPGVNPDGALEKYTYESGIVNISIVPAQGYFFTYTDGIRALFTNNVANAANEYLCVQAVMYPHPDRLPGVCFDNSPVFIDKPNYAFCIGTPNTIIHTAYDPDGDSLVYSWTPPMTTGAIPLGYVPGYGINSQLPSQNQNILNQPATLNPKTGVADFLSYTSGYFITTVKVSAYRCGILISENMRDIVVRLNANCGTVQSGNINSPPQIIPPFINSQTGLQTEFIDTVVAGSTVSFNLLGLDFDKFTNGSDQQLTVEIYGGSFGTDAVNNFANCEIQPCPVVTYPFQPPFTVSGYFDFNWQTSVDHLILTPNGCSVNDHRYDFYVRAYDNYCPANGYSYETVSIVLTAPTNIVLEAPQLRCVSVDSSGGNTLTWLPTASIDSLGLFQSYVIYAKAGNGLFIPIDSVSGIMTDSYYHSRSAQLADLGQAALQNNIYYKVKTISGYFGGQSSFFSETIRTIIPAVTENLFHYAEITWNTPTSGAPIPSHYTDYNIFQEYPVGNWTPVGSTNLNFFSDSSTQIICEDSVFYRIELNDSSGCINTSFIKGTKINDGYPFVYINNSDPHFCPSDSSELTAPYGQSFLWSNGATSQSIFVTYAGIHTVTVTQIGGCSKTHTTTTNYFPEPVLVLPPQASACADSLLMIYAGNQFVNNLVWSTGATSSAINVNTSGTYVVTATSSNGCIATDSCVVTIHTNPLPVINSNFPPRFCRGDSVELFVSGGYQNYEWYRNGVSIISSLNQNQFYAKTGGNYKCAVIDSNGCYGESVYFRLKYPCIIETTHNQRAANPEFRIEVLPNPTKNSFRIVFQSDGFIDFRLFDTAGRLVFSETANELSGELEIADIPRGIYYLNAQNKTHNNNYKLIKLE